jgi:hypothetical protein
MKENFKTQGDRSVTIDHDAFENIIATGDQNKFFIGDPVQLEDAYLEPWSVFERVNLDHFTGRKWLLGEVDAFLHSHDRGYFILEAGAGLGKTAFLAWLVKERGYIHHFVELAPGLDGVECGLKNLAAQLILAFKLSPEILPSAARPEYLSKLLKEASKKRSEGEKIVLVVDALDEAGTPEGQNVLGLPNVLPGGVYIIVSQRPVPVKLHLENSRYVFHLTAESNDNLSDMLFFLRKAASWPRIAQALDDGNCTSEQFIETLMKKCLGVWIYLKYVIHEIERGERSTLDLDALPDGLTQYYAAYWSRWRDRDENGWYDIYLPVLTTLTAAQEAVTLEHLIGLSNVDVRPQKLYRVLREQWRPFLVVLGNDQEEKYRLYHATLRDFFEGYIGRGTLASADEAFITELARATHEAHNRFVVHYLTAWGDLEKGLPGLKKEAQRNIDQGYGLRHLAAHLEASDRFEDLHLLLALETNEKRNAWFEAKEISGHVSGYVNDVARAWRCAERLYNPADCIGNVQNIGMQIRYALIIVSVNNLFASISPVLLYLLVENAIWSPAQGLAYARQIPSLVQRTEALWKLSFEFEDPQRTEVLKEALDLAKEINEKYIKFMALNAIASNLIEPQRTAILGEALEAIRGIENCHERGEALATIAPKLPESLRRETITIALGIEDDLKRGEALVTIASHLSEPLKTEIQRKAIKSVLEIEDDLEKGDCLVMIASHLSEPLKTEIQRKAINSALEIEDDLEKGKCLVRIASHLPETLNTEALRKAFVIAAKLLKERYYENHLFSAGEDPLSQLFFSIAISFPEPQEAIEITKSMMNHCLRVAALAKIAPLLPESKKENLLNEAICLLDGIKIFDGNHDRAEALAYVASFSPEPQKTELLEDAINAALGSRNKFEPRGGAYYTVSLLELIASHSSEPDRTKILRCALRCAHKLDEDYGNEKALEHILNNLYGLEVSLEVANEINEKNDRSKALAWIGSNVSEPKKTEVLREALTVATKIDDEFYKDKALETIVYKLNNLQVALEIVHEIRNDGIKSRAFVAIVPHLPENLLGEALKIVGEIKDELKRKEALIAIVPILPENLLKEAHKVARKIEDEIYRDKALESIASTLDDPHLALEIVHEIRNEGVKYSALTAIIPNLPENLLGKALKVVRHMEFAWFKRELLIAIAPLLPENLIVKALTVACGGSRDRDRNEALIAIAPCIPENLLGQALKVVREIGVGDNRDEALESIASTLNSPHVALEIAHEIQDDHAKSRALAAIAPHLPENLLGEALKVVREIGVGDNRDEALESIASTLNSPHVALEIAHEIRNDSIKSRALAAIAPHLPENLLGEALKVVREIGVGDNRDEALESIASTLNNPHVALEIAHEIRNDSIKSRALDAIVPHLPENLLGEALKVVHEIGVGDIRDYALGTIASKLDNPQAALEIAHEIQNDDAKSRALAAIAPHLPENLLGEALKVVREIQECGAESRALAAIAPHLPENLLGEALGIAKEFKNDMIRAEVLSAIAPLLPESQKTDFLREALEAFCQIGYASNRTGVLLAMMPHIPELLAMMPHIPENLSRDFLEAAQTIEYWPYGAEVLSAIALHIPENLLRDFLEIAQEIGDEKHRAEVLSAIAPHIPENLLRDFFEVAQKIQDEKHRAEVLSAIAPHIPENLLRDFLEAAQKIEDKEYRAGLMACIASNLAGLSPIFTYTLWIENLRISARRTRMDLLSDLSALVPFIIELNGLTAVENTAIAINKVGQWWP